MEKHILITGGSGSQYAADILDRFLSEGANVHILTRDIEGSKKKLSDKILIYKSLLNLYEVDYENYQSLETAVYSAAKKSGIDALINCAATAKIGRVEDISMDDWKARSPHSAAVPPDSIRAIRKWTIVRCLLHARPRYKRSGKCAVSPKKDSTSLKSS